MMWVSMQLFKDARYVGTRYRGGAALIHMRLTYKTSNHNLRKHSAFPRPSP